MAKKVDCLNDRPLYDLKALSTTIVIDINDLPVTSPHGSYSETIARNLGFGRDQNAIRGTATAHLDTFCNFHQHIRIAAAETLGALGRKINESV